MTLLLSWKLLAWLKNKFDSGLCRVCVLLSPGQKQERKERESKGRLDSDYEAGLMASLRVLKLKMSY